MEKKKKEKEREKSKREKWEKRTKFFWKFWLTDWKVCKGMVIIIITFSLQSKYIHNTILIFRFYCLSPVYKERKFAPFFFFVSFYLFLQIPQRTAIKLISPIIYTVRHYFILCFIENSRGIHVRTTLISKHDVHTFTIMHNCYQIITYIAYTGRKYFWWFQF